MAALTSASIAQLMRTAGFPDSEISTGVGVAMAESGGNPKAHNSTPPDDSYGLFQINMLGSLGPARRKQFGISNNAELFDPATNAKAAYMVWKGSGWKAWTTYTSGKYKDAAPKDAGNDGGGIVDAVKALNPVTGVADSINAASRNFVKGFVSTGGVLVGITVLVLGFFLLMRSQVSVQKIAGVAAKVAK